MPASQFQTTISTATIPRMRPAAPFGARPILLFLLMFFAAPLWAAADARWAESHAAMGALKDLLVKAYEKAGALDPHWTLADLGVQPADLSGDYYDASNYILHIESVNPPVALIICRVNFDYQRGDYARCDLLTGQMYFIGESAPSDMGTVVWPQHRHFNAKAQEEFEERCRFEWLWLVGLFVAFTLGALCSWFTQQASQARIVRVLSMLAMGGFALGIIALLLGFWTRMRLGTYGFEQPWIETAVYCTGIGGVAAGMVFQVALLEIRKKAKCQGTS